MVSSLSRLSLPPSPQGLIESNNSFPRVASANRPRPCTTPLITPALGADELILRKNQATFGACFGPYLSFLPSPPVPQPSVDFELDHDVHNVRVRSIHALVFSSHLPVGPFGSAGYVAVPLFVYLHGEEP